MTARSGGKKEVRQKCDGERWVYFFWQQPTVTLDYVEYAREKSFLTEPEY